MADNGANIFSDFIETASNVGNLFAIFIIAGLIPFLRWINKTIKTIADNKKARQTEYIKSVTEGITKPVKDEMATLNTIMQKQSEQTEAIIENVEKIQTAINKFAEIQSPINGKVEWIEMVLKNSIKFVPEDELKKLDDETNNFQDQDRSKKKLSRFKSN